MDRFGIFVWGVGGDAFRHHERGETMGILKEIDCISGELASYPLYPFYTT